MFESIDYIHTDGTTERMNKLQAVQAELEPFLDDIAQKMRENDELKKPRKIAWKPRIYSKIESVLIKLERPMSNALALQMTAEQLYECYDMYCELCCWIEEKTGISYNKRIPEFCNFAGITATAFANFQTDGDPSQKEAWDDINNRLADSVLTAAECGENKSTSSEFRLTAKSPIGHKIQTTTAHEPALVIPISNNSFTPISEYTAQLAVMPDKKLLKGGK